MGIPSRNPVNGRQHRSIAYWNLEKELLALACARMLNWDGRY